MPARQVVAGKRRRVLRCAGSRRKYGYGRALPGGMARICCNGKWRRAGTYGATLHGFGSWQPVRYGATFHAGGCCQRSGSFGAGFSTRRLEPNAGQEFHT
ncbi:hypothetical protein NPIL_522521 [Nephila pilipes]|uniref:Uncharacterized protein n=1 Tax=Nephila pilipes TaxID=299642 RepID=A0A8X6UK98_NEPPI|nr:hypothetical protein NPIL_522521 [Nephila pilipes]